MSAAPHIEIPVTYPYATIDLNALAHNICLVKKKFPSAKILAMLKANAYGHGAAAIAKSLSGHADALAVARLPEALELRASGYQGRLVVMSGFFDEHELLLYVKNKLDSVVHCFAQLTLLNNLRSPEDLRVWLKADIGMHRLGFLPQEWPEAYRQAKKCVAISELILMTHFPNADDPSDPSTEKQIGTFYQLIEKSSESLSLAKSGVIVGFSKYLQAYGEREQWLRPGIMLYGGSPLKDVSAAELGLRPVMTLRSRVIVIRNFGTDEPVGYGGDYRCTRPTRAAVVAIGYGDGYPRRTPSGTPVLIRDHYAPVIGRVSMDFIVIDITDVPTVDVGDEVILWGEGLPAEEIAKAVGTSVYELFCRIMPRVRIEYI